MDTRSLRTIGLLIASVALIGAGCDSVTSFLGTPVQQVGGFLKNSALEAINQHAQSAKDALKQKRVITGENLTDEEQRIIDEWLDGNRLNEFGDPRGTEYENGSPLFNPKTGQIVSRYQYLLDRFPRLTDLLPKEEEAASQEDFEQSIEE